jgi:hypothetical protein
VADVSSKATGRLVFVSLSGPDTWVAKQIAREIEARDATPFLDEAEVDAGADFEEDIIEFRQKAHELVVLPRGFWNALKCGRTRPGIPVPLKKRDLLELNDVEVYLGQLRVRVQQGEE